MLKIAYVLEDLDEKLFEEIFGHTFAALADKLINTASKKKVRCLLMISK